MLSQPIECPNPIEASLKEVEAYISHDEIGMATLSQMGQDVSTEKFCRAVAECTRFFFATNELCDLDFTFDLKNAYFFDVDDEDDFS